MRCCGKRLESHRKACASCFKVCCCTGCDLNTSCNKILYNLYRGEGPEFGPDDLRGIQRMIKKALYILLAIQFIFSFFYLKKAKADIPAIISFYQSDVELNENGEEIINIAWSSTSEKPAYNRVFYSNDNGKTWNVLRIKSYRESMEVDLSKLAGGAKCRFQIQVYDGSDIATRIGSSFKVSDKPPVRVNIIAPTGGRTYYEGSGVLLIGQAFDLEDGNIKKPFTWLSNLDGTIGSNAQKIVVRNLTIGTHKIRLKVADTQGNSAVSEPLTVHVVRRP